VGIAAARL